MRIQQITSKFICGEKFVGKWYCSDSVKDTKSNERIIRYLLKDGTWGRNIEYFDSWEELDKALAIGNKPDFNVSQRERWDIQTMTVWMNSDKEREENDTYQEMMGGEW